MITIENSKTETINMNNIEVHNLTPHCINLYTDDGIIAIPSEGLARASMTSVPIGTINGVTVYKNEYGEVTGLPEEKSGHIYIVSALAANAVPHRPDVFITNDAVRNEGGHIIGCRSWAHV